LGVGWRCEYTYDGSVSTAQPEPVDPVDEELDQLLRHPKVRERLDDFERRRREGKLGEGRSHNEARRIVGLPPLPDDDPRL
jgi:hypothetical protein